VYKLQFCTFIFAVLLPFGRYYGHFVVYSFTCFQAVFIGSVIWFIFENLRYISYLHNVCTILANLFFFAPFVEIEHFDDWEPFTAVLAHFLCTFAETA